VTFAVRSTDFSAVPQRHDDGRLDVRQFLVEPVVAGLDLALRRGLVQAPLAARLPLEMLDGVGDVDGVAVDAGLGADTVEQLAGRPDEGLAGQVFLVARLLADEHDLRLLRAFAGNGLGRELPQFAAPAFVQFRRLLALRLGRFGAIGMTVPLRWPTASYWPTLRAPMAASLIMCGTIFAFRQVLPAARGMCWRITPAFRRAGLKMLR
jgi:hypothetical protein